MKQIRVIPVQDYNGERYLIPPHLETKFWEMQDDDDLHYHFKIEFNRFKVDDFNEHTLHLQAEDSPLWRALVEAQGGSPKSIIDAMIAKAMPTPAKTEYQEVKHLTGPHNWVYIVPADEEQAFKQLVAALDKATAKRWAKIRDQFEVKYGHLRTGKYNPKFYIKNDSET